MSEKDDKFAIFKFTYLPGTRNKLIFICSCGEELELFDIHRNISGTSIGLNIESTTESVISIKCTHCGNTVKFRQRGYTLEEDVKYRFEKIDNLLSKK